MGMRIELTQRYMDDEAAAYYVDEIGMKPPEDCYRYRRIYPHLQEIRYPMEIPGDKDHCEVLFWDDTSIVVQGSYDDLCFLFDDREAMDDEGGLD
jgi:hypothetical protein